MPQNGKSSVLLIGDAMEDYFHLIDHQKENPTAKYPIYASRAILTAPGGAANVRAILNRFRVDHSSLLSYRKPQKRYLIQDDTPIARVDDNDVCEPCSTGTLRHLLPLYDIIVVSDYAKGTLHKRARDLINAAPGQLLIDTKLDPTEWRADATFFPNTPEYERYADSYNKLPCVVQKLGPKGARLLSDGHELKRSSPYIITHKAANTIGAGDVFLAAWVRATLDELPLEQRLDYAVEAASLACQYPFTDCPTLAQLEAFYDGEAVPQ